VDPPGLTPERLAATTPSSFDKLSDMGRKMHLLPKSSLSQILLVTDVPTVGTTPVFFGKHSDLDVPKTGQPVVASTVRLAVVEAWRSWRCKGLAIKQANEASRLDIP